jgi:mono/diheme cytochrome c family protein
MNEQEKHEYAEKYSKAKQKGVKFFPDIIYKDLLVSFAIFLLVVGLATFIGVPNEPKVDPIYTAYVPRPEWYFLFLFQLLKYFPGKIEWLDTAVIPGLAILVLFLLPFLDRNPDRHWSKRRISIGVMSVMVAGIVGLTILAAVTTPRQVQSGTLATTLTEKISAGQDLFSVNCVECHGADGVGGEVKGVKGLEGVVLKPIHAQDILYTFTDETFYNIIEMGQPVQGMPPFGRAYGGQLGPSEIDAIVAFIRYTWDDRAELPKEASPATALPTLGPAEVPSYNVHVASIIKRFCLSCHRPGKENNHFSMQTYREMLTTGDHAPNLIAGNLNSNLIRMLHREKIEVGGPMPPTKELKPELIQIIERWVLAGMPETADQAARPTPAAMPGAGTVMVTPTLTTTMPTFPLTPTP